MFQDYLLFPHLSVLENVAFGLRSRGTSRAGRAAACAASGSRASGSPTAPATSPRRCRAVSSSASRSRARWSTEPRLLLLDEPLAALDVGTRTELRRDLRAHLATFAGARVLVTHELLDAVALADRLVVLEDGRVAQAGPVAEVAGRPRSRYVADLVGVNLLRGRGAGSRGRRSTAGEWWSPRTRSRATCTSRSSRTR